MPNVSNERQKFMGVYRFLSCKRFCDKWLLLVYFCICLFFHSFTSPEATTTTQCLLWGGAIIFGKKKNYFYKVDCTLIQYLQFKKVMAFIYLRIFTPKMDLIKWMSSFWPKMHLLSVIHSTALALNYFPFNQLQLRLLPASYLVPNFPFIIKC